MPHTDRVTLAEIALEAGVSLSTISKVLNGGPDVASATRARVEELLQASGYRRRRGSRGGEHVEVVMPRTAEAWAFRVLDGIRESAARTGLTVTLATPEGGDAEPHEWVRAALHRRPAGVVLLPSPVSTPIGDELASRGIPVVLVDRSGDAPPGFSSVGSADWSGGVLAARHLTALGHERVAAVVGPEDALASRARIDGLLAGLGAGVRAPAVVEHGATTQEDAARRAASLLAAEHPPTAIFAGTETLALGVLEAARAAGLSVPCDVSVVGFEDLDIAQLAAPALTTVRQPLHEMGDVATRLVQRSGDEPAIRLELATSLIVRDSTGAARSSPRV